VTCLNHNVRGREQNTDYLRLVCANRNSPFNPASVPRPSRVNKNKQIIDLPLVRAPRDRLELNKSLINAHAQNEQRCDWYRGGIYGWQYSPPSISSNFLTYPWLLKFDNVRFIVVLGFLNSTNLGNRSCTNIQRISFSKRYTHLYWLLIREW